MGDDGPTYRAYLDDGADVFAEGVYADEAPTHLRPGYDGNVGSPDEIAGEKRPILHPKMTNTAGICSELEEWKDTSSSGRFFRADQIHIIPVKRPMYLATRTSRQAMRGGSS